MDVRNGVLAWSYLLGLCFLIFRQTAARGLRCYQCDSLQEPDCGIPFHGRPSLLANCRQQRSQPAYCVLIHNHNTSRVQRGCDSTVTLKLAWRLSEMRIDPEVQTTGTAMECVTDTVTPFFERVTQCRCTQPACNSAPSSSPAPSGLMLALIGLLGHALPRLAA